MLIEEVLEMLKPLVSPWCLLQLKMLNKYLMVAPKKSYLIFCKKWEFDPCSKPVPPLHSLPALLPSLLLRCCITLWGTFELGMLTFILIMNIMIISHQPSLLQALFTVYMLYSVDKSYHSSDIHIVSICFKSVLLWYQSVLSWHVKAYKQKK